MKQKRSYWAEDGTFWEQTFGYCRQSNARLLGWAVVLLGSVLNLVLLCVRGGQQYVLGVTAAGAALGWSWLAENLIVSGKSHQGNGVMVAAILSTMLCYAFALVR